MQKNLKIDLDWVPPAKWLSDYAKMIQSICGLATSEPAIFKLSSSKRGFHITIPLGVEISDEDAMELQFLLGDDRTRCRLNYARWKAGIKGWNKFFKYKVHRKV